MRVDQGFGKENKAIVNLSPTNTIKEAIENPEMIDKDEVG